MLTPTERLLDVEFERNATSVVNSDSVGVSVLNTARRFSDTLKTNPVSIEARYCRTILTIIYRPGSII